MSNILITGFDAFQQHKSNPSESLAQNDLWHSKLDGFNVIPQILPTSYYKAEQTLRGLIGQFNPILTISFGLNEKLVQPAIELTAQNMDHCPAPDNDGNLRVHQSIDAQQPFNLWTNYKTEAKGSRYSCSYHPGNYVCNHLFFHSLLLMEGNSLFVHIPAILDESAFIAEFSRFTKSILGA